MKQRLAFGAALVLAALAYSPGLAGPLVLDDRANLEPLLRWMGGSLGWQAILFDNHAGLFGRSLSMLTFLANVATTGKDVYWMKATNLALHLACGVAVYALLSVWMRLKAFVPGTPAAVERWIPCLAAAMWLLHPLLVSTVLYVVQRMAILATLFTLLTMLAYLKGRVALSLGDRRRGWLLLGLVVPAGTVLALLSKENGILALALCGLMEWLVFPPADRMRRTLASRGFITATLVLPAIAATVLCVIGAPLFVGGYVNRDFTLVERLLTQSRVLWDYIGAILLPYGPRLGLYHDDFSISRGLFTPPSTLFAIVAWAALLVVAWRIRKRIPAVPLGIGIFLVGQALESTVFPLLMYFEHRVYLPSVGILWAALGLSTAAGTYLQKRMHHGSAVFATAAVALVIALGFACAARAGVWRYQQTILEQALRNHPDSRWLRMDLAAYDMSKRPSDVTGALTHADYLMSMPGPSDRRSGALLRLTIECLQGQSVDSDLLERVFGGKVDTIEPDLLVAYETLSARVTKVPCHGLDAAGMAKALARMLDASPLPVGHRSVWRLRFQAARLYWLAGDPDLAIRQARLAWAGRPREAPVPLFLAGMLLQTGRREEAAGMLDSASALIDKDDRTGSRILSEYRAALAHPALTE